MPRRRDCDFFYCAVITLYRPTLWCPDTSRATKQTFSRLPRDSCPYPPRRSASVKFLVPSPARETDLHPFACTTRGAHRYRRAPDRGAAACVPAEVVRLLFYVAALAPASLTPAHTLAASLDR